MGYTKVVQYGNYTEIYEYEKDLNTTRRPRKALSKIQKARKNRRESDKPRIRSPYSIRRARRNFFRICHANNLKAKTIHFCTLTLAEPTDYRTFLRYLSEFHRRLKNGFQEEGYPPISYIGVPELTKKGTYHFHLLIYNLPPTERIRERKTRNLQRCAWQRGYLDIRYADRVTSGIAGYMAKYMGKFLANPTNEARRAYSSSRNIDKVTITSGNKVFDKDFTPHPVGEIAQRVTTYDVPYLGTCKYSRYQVL